MAGYEDAVRDLCRVEILLAHWGTATSLDSLTLPLARLSDGLVDGAGNSLLLALRAYPVQLLAYAAGIAATNARDASAS